MAKKEDGTKKGRQEPTKGQQPPPEVKELMSRKQLEVLCTVRAWKDENFRKKLLANPKATLQEALKIKFPAAMTVTIVEETPNSIHVSLPPKPAAEGELSDDQLEAVAGGRGAIEGTLNAAASAFSTVSRSISDDINWISSWGW